MAHNCRHTGPILGPQIMMVPIPPWRFFVLRMIRNAGIAAHDKPDEDSECRGCSKAEI